MSNEDGNACPALLGAVCALPCTVGSFLMAPLGTPPL